MKIILRKMYDTNIHGDILGTRVTFMFRDRNSAVVYKREIQGKVGTPQEDGSYVVEIPEINDPLVTVSHLKTPTVVLDYLVCK